MGASATAARYSWSIELMTKGRREMEVDFVGLVGGRLSVGEAKVNGKFDSKPAEAVQEVRKTVRGARLLRADEVVFATTLPSWKPAALAAIVDHTSELDRPQRRILSGLAARP